MYQKPSEPSKLETMAYTWVAAVKGLDAVEKDYTFAAKGLPYISKNFSGDRYSATRHKIRKWIEREFGCTRENIKKIFVNMDTGDVKVTIDNGHPGSLWMEQLCEMIKTHPVKELSFSWEQTIKDRKTEKDWLAPYKATMYLPDCVPDCNDRVKLANEAQLALEELDFQTEMKIWEEQREMEELLCEKDDEGVEDVASMLSDLTLKRKREKTLFIFDAEDLEREPSPKKINIEETFDSDKQWTPQEICEKIRLLQVSGQIKISTEDMKKITQDFGERRVLKN